MARIDSIFRIVKEEGASDLHLGVGHAPRLRMQGEIEPIDSQPLTDAQLRELVYEILTKDQLQQFERQHDLDFAYEVNGEMRVRCNIYEDIRGMAGAFRLLPSRVPSIEELNLPSNIIKLTQARRGLVVVTGPPGSGKSTTQAALIDTINKNQKRHIITIEDPVEYLHVSGQSLIHQREVGRHTESFSSALRAALREDPDIILVGEMRDPETVSLAVTAAETGQLVLGTLHTSSAAQTVSRIIDTFEVAKQQQVRAMLADSLRGVIAQKLLPLAEGEGRIAAVEILIGTQAVSYLIRENKAHMIKGILQSGRKEGMVEMEASVADLLREGKITADVALRNGVDGARAEKRKRVA